MDITGDIYEDPDTGIVIVDESQSKLPIHKIVDKFKDMPIASDPAIASLANWANGTNRNIRYKGNWGRDAFLDDNNMFSQFDVAQKAVQKDDVISGAIESTGSIMMNRIRMNSDDEDQENVLNQITTDMDLVRIIREIWVEMFTVSQGYVGIYWGKKSYTPTNQNERKRKKSISLTVPQGVTVFDPKKVIPWGNSFFRQDKMVYLADDEEGRNFDDVLAGKIDDPIVSQFIVRRIEIPRVEQRRIRDEIGEVNLDEAFLMNPKNVFRITATKPDYRRFAEVRLRSVFDLLDLKHQLKAMDRAFLIGGPLRVDQRIATPDGWKFIGDAQVGDQVFSADGNVANIVGVHPQGVLTDMYEVTFTDGAKVICDGSHPWNVFGARGRSTEKTLKLNEIMEIGLRDNHGNHRHRIPIAEPLDLPEADLEVDPYLLGYMIGDGCFVLGTPRITCAESLDDQPWREVLPDKISVSQYTDVDFGLVDSRWHYNELTEDLKTIGLWEVKGSKKFIPEHYLWSSKEQRFALLQGLLDSDGNPHQRGSAEFSTSSERLAEDVVHLAQSLGGVATIYEAQPRGKGRSAYYRVYVTLHTDEAPFRMKRKAEKWTPRKHDYVRAITRVEPIDAAEAVCITTDRDDGLFLTEGMVVTHNSNMIVVVKKGSDDMPASDPELQALAQQVQRASRTPIMVGDHRLAVEIVTPKLDKTLAAERYNAIDSRITSRVYNILSSGNYASGVAADDSTKLMAVIARNLEAKRDDIGRFLMATMMKELFERNSYFNKPAMLNFYPKRIAVALAADVGYLRMIVDMYLSGNISQHSLLEEFDFDYETELRLKEKENSHQEIWNPITPQEERNQEMQEKQIVREDQRQKQIIDGKVKGGNQHGGGQNPSSSSPSPKNQPSRKQSQVDNERRDTDNKSK